MHLSFPRTFTQALRARVRVRERVYCVRGEYIIVLGVLHYTWYNSISRNFCWVFSPMRVSEDKYVCSFVLLYLYFFQWSFAYGYDVMMRNIFISCITIKNITWYQSHPEISLCAAETLLQLQLLKIRVSWLKTLEDKK